MAVRNGGEYSYILQRIKRKLHILNQSERIDGTFYGNCSGQSKECRFMRNETDENILQFPIEYGVTKVSACCHEDTKMVKITIKNKWYFVL